MALVGQPCSFWLFQNIPSIPCPLVRKVGMGASGSAFVVIWAKGWSSALGKRAIIQHGLGYAFY